MKINVKNNLPDDVEVQMVQTFDGSVSIIISEAKLSETKSRILGDAKPGEVVKIGDRYKGICYKKGFWRFLRL